MQRILIVDDSPTMRRMIKSSLLGLSDVTFSEAGTGLEALERLAVEPVAMLVLDLNMPDMHGLDVLKFVRGHDLHRRTPVIVLTTRGDDDSRGAALQAGANLYVTKPFAPDTLAALAEGLLSGDSRGTASRSPTSRPPSQ